MIYSHLYDFYGTVLKLDIDTNYIPFFTFKGIQYLSRYYHLQKFILKKSPSKKHYHIILGIKERMTDSEIIAWQFALGSDKYRERFNLLRHINGNRMKEWNLLFDNKTKYKISLKVRKHL
jgi:hypothetical protein